MAAQPEAREEQAEEGGAGCVKAGAVGWRQLAAVVTREPER